MHMFSERFYYGDQFTFDAADRRVVFNDIYGLCDRKSRAFEGGRQQGYIKDRAVSDHSLCYHQCVSGGLYQREGTGAFAGLCSLCYAAGGITCHCVDCRPSDGLK